MKRHEKASGEENGGMSAWLLAMKRHSCLITGIIQSWPISDLDNPMTIEMITPYPYKLLMEDLKTPALFHFLFRSTMRSLDSFLRIMVFPRI